MLTHPTLDQLHQLGLLGMAKAFGEVETSGEAAALTHPEWLALLLDREMTYRHDKKLAARLRYARLRQQAAVEDVDYRAVRGLDRALFQKLAIGDWIDASLNRLCTIMRPRCQVVISVKTPSAMTRGTQPPCMILSRLAEKNARSMIRNIPDSTPARSTLHCQCVRKLFGELALARGDGRYARIVRALGGVQLLILDDWGLEPLDAQARHDLLEILEERYGRRSTIITSQLPVESWHAVIGDPTYADAILDRLVHNAQRLNLSGDSLRRTRSKSSNKS